MAEPVGPRQLPPHRDRNPATIQAIRAVHVLIHRPSRTGPLPDPRLPGICFLALGVETPVGRTKGREKGGVDHEVHVPLFTFGRLPAAEWTERLLCGGARRVVRRFRGCFCRNRESRRMALRKVAWKDGADDREAGIPPCRRKTNTNEIDETKHLESCRNRRGTIRTRRRGDHDGPGDRMES